MVTINREATIYEKQPLRKTIEAPEQWSINNNAKIASHTKGSAALPFFHFGCSAVLADGAEISRWPYVFSLLFRPSGGPRFWFARDRESWFFGTTLITISWTRFCYISWTAFRSNPWTTFLKIEYARPLTIKPGLAAGRCIPRTKYVRFILRFFIWTLFLCIF